MSKQMSKSMTAFSAATALGLLLVLTPAFSNSSHAGSTEQERCDELPFPANRDCTVDLIREQREEIAVRIQTRNGQIEALNEQVKANNEDIEALKNKRHNINIEIIELIGG